MAFSQVCDFCDLCDDDNDGSVHLVRDDSMAHRLTQACPASLGVSRPNQSLPGGLFPHHFHGNPFSQQIQPHPSLDGPDQSCDDPEPLHFDCVDLDTTVHDILMYPWLRWHCPPEPAQRLQMLQDISRCYRSNKDLDRFLAKFLITAFFTDRDSYTRQMPDPKFKLPGSREHSMELIEKWIMNLDDCMFRSFLLYAEVWCFLDGKGKRPNPPKERGLRRAGPLPMQPRSQKKTGNTKRKRKPEPKKDDMRIVPNEALLGVRTKEVQATFLEAYGEPLSQNKTVSFLRAVSRKIDPKDPLGHTGGRYEGWAWVSQLDVPSYERVLRFARGEETVD